MKIALVYMLGGLSSRFGGKPKHFACVGPNNETMLEISLNQAVKAGFSKIIFIIRKETLEDFKKIFQDNYKNIPIFYAFQEFNKEKRDKPWGTADALCSASHLLGCPFIVCNGDDIYGEEAFKILASHLKENKTGATISYKLSEAIPETGSVNRSIFKVDKNNKLISIEETFNIAKWNLKEKNLSDDSISSQNIFALLPESLIHLKNSIKEFKDAHKEDRRIECLLPQELNNLINKKKAVIMVYASTEKPLGITNPEDEEKIKEQLKNIKNEPTSP